MNMALFLHWQQSQNYMLKLHIGLYILDYTITCCILHHMLATCLRTNYNIKYIGGYLGQD